MHSLTQLWLAIAAVAMAARAQSITPTNETSSMDYFASGKAVELSVSFGSDMVPLGRLLALSTGAEKDIPVSNTSALSVMEHRD